MDLWLPRGRGLGKGRIRSLGLADGNYYIGASGEKSTCQSRRQIWSLGQEDTLEKEMAIHCDILAWEIPWAEEPSRLQSTCVCAKSLQSCPTLCNTLDQRQPGSSVHGILQARILTGVGCHALHQGIFPIQGSNPCLLCLLHWQAGSYR